MVQTIIKHECDARFDNMIEGVDLVMSNFEARVGSQVESLDQKIKKIEVNINSKKNQLIDKIKIEDVLSPINNFDQDLETNNWLS